MNNPEIETILRPLLTALFESGLDDARWQQLRRILHDHPEARAEYVKYVSLHAQLTGELEWQAGADPIAIDRPRRVSFARPAMALAAVLALTAAIVAVYLVAFATGPEQADTYDGPPVAVVVAAEGAIFVTDPVTSGDDIPATPVEISRGSLTLDFRSGATVELRGPARFVPTGERGGRLESGRLFARAPGDGTELRIVGPDFSVIDLGTAFAVRVNGPGDSDVFVTDGSVEIETDNGLTEIVHAGQGYHIGIDPKFAYLTDEQAIEAFGPAVLAQNEAERLVLESEPAAYLPLSRTTSGGWRDLATNEPFNAVGVRHDDASGAAVFDGTGGIELGERDDLMIDSPMTLEMKVWIDPGTKGKQRLVSVDRGNPDGRVGWGVGVESRDGGYRPFFTHYRVLDYRFDTDLPAGRWVHLAFVVDRDTISLFVDGELRGTHNRSGKMMTGPTHAYVGRLADGTERFHGRIAWLAVHEHVLNPREITQRLEPGEQP